MATESIHASREYRVESNPGVTPSLDAHDDLEPIAVVGFSLKYPQDADSPGSFWSMLVEKKCAMTEWPKDRINLDAFYHRDEDRDEKVFINCLWLFPPSISSAMAKWSNLGLCAWCTLRRGGPWRVRRPFLWHISDRSCSNGSPASYPARGGLSRFGER